MAAPASVDEYMAALHEEQRAALEVLRRTIMAVAPEATEVIAYQMPGLRIDGRLVVSYAAFKRHYSLFPASEAVREALGEELEPYLTGKGTISFPADRPVPVDLVTRIVEVRLGETVVRDRP